MKYTFFLIIIFCSVYQFGQVAGSRNITIADCNYPILGIETNNSSDKIVITASQGRVFCLNIADVQTKEEVTPIWKNIELSGYNLGGKPQFSQDDKYILLQESSALKTAPTSRKVKDIKFCVLNATDGKVVFDGKDANSVQFVNGKNELLISTDEGIIIKDFITNKTIAELKISKCEIAAISSDLKTIAVSFDPEKSDFKEVESIGANKGELRKAIWNKRLVSFYSYPDFKKTHQSAEELDIIYTLKFNADNSQLYLFSRNVEAERIGTAGLNAMTMTAADSRRQSNIQVLNAKTGELIKEIYHATAEPDACFKIDNDSKYFSVSDNDGFIGRKKKVVVFDVNQQMNKMAQYRYQGKKESSNIFPIYFSYLKNKPIMFLTNGTKLIEWNFEILKEYTDYIEGVDTDSLQISAVKQLNADLNSPESALYKNIVKQNITGIFLFDITVQKKGQIVTIFAASDEKTNIPFQNALKDILLKYKFINVDVPANQKLKFRYTFNLTNTQNE